MPPPAGSGQPSAPYGFIGLVVAVHIFDILIRYGTTPFQIGVNPGSPWLWSLFFFLYGLVYIDASSLEAFKGVGHKKLLLIAIIAYVWGPMWSILPGYFPAIKYVAALMMLIAPFWLLAAFFATQSFPNLSLLYTIIWFFLIVFALFPNIQTYAEEKGYPLPNSLSPGMVLSYSWEKISTGITTFYDYMFVKAPAMISEEVSRSIAMAKGDYYTGQVDAAAKQRLGVYLENFRTSETSFYENTPVIAYATMKAETIDKELKINIACDSDGNASASQVRPQSEFSVITSDQYDIDCIWNKGLLGKGSHNLRLRAEFPFTTRAYLKTYIMDRDRLREYRKLGTDPLANIPDKNPSAIYTSGPIRVGMGIGQQPVALGRGGEALSSLGVTIDNAWEGKVLDLTGVYIFVPKGLKVSSIEGVDITQATCEDIPEEERQSCDDTLTNIYALTTNELSLPYYKNLTTKTFRIPIDIDNPEKVLGKAPIAVQNFKVSVQYRYMIERTASATVKAVEQPTP
jgi:hypothetical protein